MTSKAGGRKTKDAAISDNFNLAKLDGMSQKELNKARRLAMAERKKIEDGNKKAAEELLKVSDQLAKIGKKVGLDVGVEAPAPPASASDIQESDEPSKDSDAQSAYQMLQNLRYAFKNAVGPSGKKGKQRLVELMGTDTEFKFFVKELTKIEASLLSAKIRKEGDGNGQGGGQQNFFVILKGLEEEKKFITTGSDDKTVDLKQITRAINPTQGEVYEEEEANRGDKPDEIIRKVETIEDTEGW
jgi:hypothetical protein